MFKVIVVEDQEFIANAIAEMIQNQSEHFKVSGIYYNGQQCLKDIDNTSPDIVITDIRMPEMDGISLSRVLMEHYPNIKIIILSGYEDFAYAREAIKIGVCNYLLKPCRTEELMQSLNEAASKLVEERSQKEQIQQYENLFIENLPTLRQQALITSIFTEEKLAAPEKLGLNHLIQNSQLFLIDVDEQDKIHSQEEELYVFCCGNMLEELLLPLEKKEFFLCNSQFILIASIDPLIFEKSKICLEKACTRVEQIVQRPIRYFEGGVLHSLEDCRTAYHIALEKSRQNRVFLENTNSKKESQNVLEQARQYILANYNKDISLQDVADITYVSYNYLSSLFTQNLGVNFSVYLSKIRIEKACELLKTPSNRIAEISEKVGYSNYRYFNHVFKKMTGYTPSEYRRLK